MVFQPALDAQTVFGNWKLNDNAGNYDIIDSNGGPNGHFEAQYCGMNASKTTSDVSVDGILGTAMYFNRADKNSVITSGGIAGCNTTISIWFKTPTLGVVDGEWFRVDGLMSAEKASGTADLGINYGGSSIRSGVNNTTIYGTTTGLNDDGWHLATMTRCKATGVMLLYLDGVLEGCAVGGTNTLTTAAYGIGSNYKQANDGHDKYFCGTLDDARAYNIVLTPEEIANMFALNTVWDTNADGNWSSICWSGDIMPDDVNSRAVFSNNLGSTCATTSGDRTITLDTNATVGALVFDDDNNFTVAGCGANKISLDINAYNKNSNTCYAEITVDTTCGNGAHTIGADLCFVDTVLLTQNSTGDLTISGTICGVGGLIKAGAGTVILSGANTYIGDTQIDAGILQLGANDVIADAISDPRFG